MVSLTGSSDPRHSHALCRPMRLSKRCEYGIKAAVQLAQRHGAGYTQSREIATAETLPAKFLESILLALRSASILESKVGAGGGYRLARAPQSILVTDLIAALDKSEDDSARANGVGVSEDVPASGQRAIDQLNLRLDRAYIEALGSLSLFDIARDIARESATPAPAPGAGGNGSMPTARPMARATAQPVSV